MSYLASVIVSFYNKIEWMKLVLAAFERQSCSDFEIIIADDGSGEEVVKELQSVIQISPLHIQHLWHPDAGFMKNAMLNKAVLASKSDYLIFIDGDCVPHKHFVKDHIRLQAPGRILAGRRVNLSRYLTESLTTEKIRKGFLEGSFLWRLIGDSIFNKSRDVEKGLHLGCSWLNINLGSHKKGVLGCNFSVSKEAIIEVNGFDDRYQYPGVGEDTEIEYRLVKNGHTVLRPKMSLVQYHLWHERLSRAMEGHNLELFRETKEKGYIFTPYGIKQS